MGGSKSSSKKSTTATQTTTNTDKSQNAGANSLVAGGNITIKDLSADVAGAALKLGGKAVDGGYDLAERLGIGAFDLSKQTTGTAFDFLSDSGEMLLEYVENESRRNKTENLNNQELTASLSRAAFDLANEKTASADDKVFSFGRMALYVLGGLAGLFLLVQFFKRPSKA